MPETKTKKRIEFSPAAAILASGVLIAAAILFTNYFPSAGAVAQQVAEADTTPTVSANVPPVTASDWIVGSPDAPIKLVEYSDLQCPYCSLIHPTLQRIVDESDGQIAWVYRHFPLESIHPQAKPAALAAECIAEQLGNDGFWKFANTIFPDQSKMNPAYYAQLAGQFGANVATFNNCVATEEPYPKIQAQALQAQQNGGQGTPFTVVVGNGVQVPISGALPYEQIVAVINAVKSRQ